MKLIIGATDGSEGAERAIAFAADIAKSCGAKLLLVYVSQDKFTQKELNLLEQLRVTQGDAIEEISGRIFKASTVARGRGASTVETMATSGDPAKLLIELAGSKHADAIAVGRRGHSELEGLLLGSVSQKLSCLAPCVVIVVP